MEKIEIKKLGKQDLLIFQKLIRLFQEVFATEQIIACEASYLIGLLEKPGFIVYSAILENEIVGGLTAYELPMYYAAHSEMFIYDIAVRPEFQRKGLGKKLLLSLEVYCKQNDIHLMFVAANEEDHHAIDFYHSTGGQSEKVIHFNYSLAQ